VESTTALVVIDAQKNMFDPGNPVASADAMLERLTALVARARMAGMLVVFVRNCGGPADPDQRGTPGWDLQPPLEPGEGDLVLDKTTSNAFESTRLGEALAARGITKVVIAGLQSDFCVRATAHGAMAHGLGVTLVSDAHSTYPGGGRSAAEIIATVNADFADRARLITAEKLKFH